MADYQTSLDLRQQTAAAKPDDVAAVRDIGSSYDLIGDLQHARGDDAPSSRRLCQPSRRERSCIIARPAPGTPFAPRN